MQEGSVCRVCKIDRLLLEVWRYSDCDSPPPPPRPIDLWVLRSPTSWVVKQVFSSEQLPRLLSLLGWRQMRSVAS